MRTYSLVASLLPNKKWLDFAASFCLHYSSRHVPSYPQVPSFLPLYYSPPLCSDNSLHILVHRIFTQKLELTGRRFTESCFPVGFFHKQIQHMQVLFGTFNTMCCELLCKRSHILLTSCIFIPEVPAELTGSRI